MGCPSESSKCYRAVARSSDGDPSHSTIVVVVAAIPIFCTRKTSWNVQTIKELYEYTLVWPTSFLVIIGAWYTNHLSRPHYLWCKKIKHGSPWSWTSHALRNFLRLLIPVYAKQKTFPWKTLLNEIFIGVIQLSIQIKCFDKLIEIP